MHSQYAQKTADGTSEMYFSVILYKKTGFGELELAVTPQNHLVMLFQKCFMSVTLTFAQPLTAPQ